MEKIKLDNSLKGNKAYQITFMLLALGAVMISQVIRYLKIDYTELISLSLLTAGISVFFTIIFLKSVFSKYEGSYNFVMGTVVGFIISLGPAIILREIYSGNLWTFAIIIGWISGGYVSITDQIGENDDELSTPFAGWLAIGGIFFAALVGLLVLSFIVAIILSSFSITSSYLYSVVISFVIIHPTLVSYLGKKVFSQEKKEIEYKPNIKGVFGSFTGLINGLILSSILGYLYYLVLNISFSNLLIGIYVGILSGIIIGFYIGFKMEKMNFVS